MSLLDSRGLRRAWGPRPQSSWNCNGGANHRPARSAAEPLEPRVLLAAFFVSNVNDSGPGSLRQALLDVNAVTGPAFARPSIQFEIPGPGPHRITPLSPLPAVEAFAGIDGFSQDGSEANTNGTDGPIDAILQVVLDGTLAGDEADGLVLEGDVIVYGLVIQNFRGGAGIVALGAKNKIEGNFIGTDSTGLLAQSNRIGVAVRSGAGNVVGGARPSARNLISGNLDSGVVASAPATRIMGNFIGTSKLGNAPLGLQTASGVTVVAAAGTIIGGLDPDGGDPRNVISGNEGVGVAIMRGRGTQISGNNIGTDISASSAVPNLKGGVYVSESEGVQIGGPRKGETNIISGNRMFGVRFEDSSRGRVQGNYIGTEVLDSRLPNEGSGVAMIDDSMSNLIGGAALGEQNIIAYNGGAGVLVAGGAKGNAILGNSIFSNRKLGIDLSQISRRTLFGGGPVVDESDGITPNDPGDGDAGSNGLQNYPNQLFRAGEEKASTMVLRSTASTRFRIEFFFEPLPGDLQGEGKTFASFVTVTTGETGEIKFPFPAPPAGHKTTATATNLTTMDTSEFSGEEVEAPPVTPTGQTTGRRLTLIGLDGFFADLGVPPPPDPRRGPSVAGALPGQALNVRATPLAGGIDIVNGPPGFFYSVNVDSLYLLNEHTGDATLVGPTGLGALIEGDLAVHPVTGELFGAGVFNNVSRLFRVDTTTGRGTDIGAIGSDSYIPFDISGLAFVPASALGRTGGPVLLGLDTLFGAPALMVEINPATGAATTPVQLSGGLGVTVGLVYDEMTQQLLLADGSLGGTDSLYRLDPASGALTLIGPLGVEGGAAGLELSRIDDELINPPPAPAQPPDGGLVYGPSVWSGGIDFPADRDDYFLPLDRDQFISLRVETIGSPALALETTLLSPFGQVLASTTTPPGGAVTLEAAASEGGNYRLVLRDAARTDPWGHYRLTLTLNAAAEAEERGGSANDSAASAQDISATFISLPSNTDGDAPTAPPPIAPASRGAVSGRLASDGPRLFDSEDFERVLDGQWMLYTSDPDRGRTRALGSPAAAQGSIALYMWRDPISPSPFVLNEATWTVDLTGATRPALSFFHSDWGDAEHPLPEDFTGHFDGDGIAISTDGMNWHTIFNPPAQAEDQWMPYTIDLAEEAAEAGLVLGPNFMVKLQQYDNRRQPPRGGRGWDDLRITQSVMSNDWYAFTAAAGDRLGLALDESPAPPGDLLIDLYDTAGQNLLASGAPAADFEQSIGNFLAPAAGMYTVRVRNDPAGARAGGAYTLLVTRNLLLETQSNDTLDAAQNLSGTGGRVLGSVGAGATPDTDWFAFVVQAGQRLIAATSTPLGSSFEPDNALDPALELYDATGTLLSANMDGGEDGRNARIAYAVPAAGSYYVRVLGAAGTAGDYVLSLDAVKNQTQVAGRHLFYNGSAHDGGDPAADARDDAAVAPDKTALLPGELAGVDHVSSYTRGINGLMVDVAGLPPGAMPAAGDFVLEVGDGASVWRTLAAAPAVSLRRGAGASGTDRLTLSLPHNAVRNAWLRVTVKATASTGLAQPDVFYFGSLVGETGDVRSPQRVSAFDLLAVRRNFSPAGETADISNPYDVNRDGRVNALDVAGVRLNLRRGLGTIDAAPAIPRGTVVAIAATAPASHSDTFVARRVWDELQPDPLERVR